MVLTPGDRAIIGPLLDAWLDSNRPGHTSTGGDLLDHAEKIARLLGGGLEAARARYDRTVGPIIDEAAPQHAERVRSLILGG